MAIYAPTTDQRRRRDVRERALRPTTGRTSVRPLGTAPCPCRRAAKHSEQRKVGDIVTRPNLSHSSRTLRILLWCLLTLLGGAALGQNSEPTPAPAPEGANLKGFDPNGGAGKKVFDVPIEGTIDLGLAPFVERIVRAAGDQDVIALHIKTFGGRGGNGVRHAGA